MDETVLANGFVVVSVDVVIVVSASVVARKKSGKVLSRVSLTRDQRHRAVSPLFVLGSTITSFEIA